MKRIYYESVMNYLIDNDAFLCFAKEEWFNAFERKPFLIWGSGRDGKRAKKLLLNAGYEVLGFIDKKASSKEKGIFPPAVESFEKNVNIIFSSGTYEWEMDAQFRSICVNNCLSLFSYSDLVTQLIRDFIYREKNVNAELMESIREESTLFFFGDYADWGTALRAAEDQCRAGGGYDTDLIIDKVIKAYEKVRSGEALYERDGYAFKSQEYNYQFTTAVFYVVSQLVGMVEVLDFGGSLGSTFFQNKRLFNNLEMTWNIVEQRRFVEYGRKNIPEICFFDTVEQLYHEKEVDLIVLSSTLQYLDPPYIWLDRILSGSAEWMIIDRTPFLEEEKSCIVNQNVPPSIYRAVYPAWLLNYEELKYFLKERGWEEAFSWTNNEFIERKDALEQPVFRGAIFHKLC